jgi:hypothetical protein
MCGITHFFWGAKWGRWTACWFSSQMSQMSSTPPRGTPWIRLTWLWRPSVRRYNRARVSLCALRKQPFQQSRVRRGDFPLISNFQSITSSPTEEIERHVCDAQRSSDHQTNTITSVSNRATTKKKKPKIRFATWNVRTLYQEGRPGMVCV